MELLSYLGPPENAGDGAGGTPGSGNNGNGSNNNDDLLSLFDSQGETGLWMDLASKPSEQICNWRVKMTSKEERNREK